MKYCYNCKAYRPDDFAFCIQCGASFDVKYCQRLHPNPTTADYCRVCGSSDLSAPHKRPLRRGVSLFSAAAAGLAVAIMTVWFIVRSLPAYDSIPSWGIVLVLAVIAAAIAIWPR